MGLSTAFNFSSLRNNKKLCDKPWSYRQSLFWRTRDEVKKNIPGRLIYNVTAKVDIIKPYGLCEKENSTNNTGAVKIFIFQYECHYLNLILQYK